MIRWRTSINGERSETFSVNHYKFRRLALLIPAFSRLGFIATKLSLAHGKSFLGQKGKDAKTSKKHPARSICPNGAHIVNHELNDIAFHRIDSQFIE